MRMIHVERFGGPEALVLREGPDPVPGPGEALIGVQVADTLFLDTALRSGAGEDFFDLRPPYVPGGGVAGTVLAVGGGADEAWTGRRVIARTGGQTGGYADRAVVPAGALVPVPDGLGLREAAALLHDGLTAMGLMAAADIAAGRHVLILGAGGGMGVLLVQLATAAGGRVVAAARGRRKLDLVRRLGAELAVDSSSPAWARTALAATGGEGFHVVWDGVGGELGLAAFALTARGGHFSAHGAPSGDFAPVDRAEAAARGITLRGIADLWFAPEDERRLTAAALEAAASGRLRPHIGQEFPLAEAAAAHAAIEERRAVGKTLLLAA